MASSSKHTVDERTTQNLCIREADDDIKRIGGRLTLLEEEGSELKKALFQCVEERTKLIAEIYQHFESEKCLISEREVERRGETYNDRQAHITSLVQKGAGLSQILCQESNPALVKRCFKS